MPTSSLHISSEQNIYQHRDMSDFTVAIGMLGGSRRHTGAASAQERSNIGDGLPVFPNDALRTLQRSQEPDVEEHVLRETPELFQGARQAFRFAWPRLTNAQAPVSGGATAALLPSGKWIGGRS